MNDTAASTTPGWKASHVYSLALICLVIGVVSGYLLHGPAKAAAPVAEQQNAQQQGMQAGSMPTPDQISHMADKMAEPLLAELKKDPNNPELLGKIASVYMRSQNYALAADYLDRAVKAKPSADGYVSLSNALHYAGSDDKALQSLDEALKLDPKSANALFNLGMLEWQVKNDPNSAITAWEKLLKTNPNHPKRAQVENYIAKAKQHMNMPAGK